MRYLLDTNIFIYAAIDRDQLSRDVKAILDDYDNTFYMSSESVKELIVGFNNGKLMSRFWDTAAKMVKDITNRYFIRILPVGEEHMDTYAHLTLNLAEDHRDPSDHVIIAHAITNRMPLVSSDRKFKFYEDQGLELVFNEK
ncbi:MAG: type II toxin-antitoxin system VapC family toxin [Bacteroidaceae bacterium]|nr:type II toxin-antitoxin system VapC family toxin [Bacteroidaceae bacterium]